MNYELSSVEKRVLNTRTHIGRDCQLNPQMYTHSHTPTVVLGGGELFRNNFDFSGKPLIFPKGSPSWIFSRTRNQVKAVRINDFLHLTCKITRE